jgi:hypothetical protein
MNKKKDQLKKIWNFLTKLGGSFLLPGSAGLETLIFSPSLYIFCLFQLREKYNIISPSIWKKYRQEGK